jgi:hypothetical protein
MLSINGASVERTCGAVDAVTLRYAWLALDDIPKNIAAMSPPSPTMAMIPARAPMRVTPVTFPRKPFEPIGLATLGDDGPEDFKSSMMFGMSCS